MKMIKEDTRDRIGSIGNAYGALEVRKLVINGKETFEWGIDNWGGTYWEEIPKYLYEALMKYEKRRRKKENE